MLNKTIAAISTAKGKGGVAIIRISGDEALSIAQKMLRLKSSYRATQIVLLRHFAR